MTQEYLLEQELARRVGPFYLDQAASGTTNDVTIASLQSTLGLGDQWTGQYLLRRGLVDNAGMPLPSFVASDRVRRVAGPVDLSTGRVTVDRSWTNAPIAGETIELHYLDPVQELRPSVLAGLQRCFVVDRPTVATTGIAAERDITALLPWITQLGQIYEIGWIFPGVFFVERPVPWFREFMQNGHVWVSIMPDPFPNNLLITARRPASALVSPSPPVSKLLTWPIQNATTDYPVRLNVPGHPFRTGDQVLPTLVPVVGHFDGVTGAAWAVTVLDADTLALPPGAVALTAATSGTLTSWDESTTTTRSIVAGDANLAPVQLEIFNHPYLSGQVLDLTFTDAKQQAALGKAWTVTVQDANSISLNSSVATTNGNFPTGLFAGGNAATVGTATLDSLQSVLSDTDDLPVSVDYGAAAAHVAAWLRFPDRLAPAAQAGLKQNQAACAAEMTRQARMNFNPPAKRQQLAQPFPAWQTSRP